MLEAKTARMQEKAIKDRNTQKEKKNRENPRKRDIKRKMGEFSENRC